MLLVENFSIDPYYNLAAEEYFLKKVPDDVVMLWRNDRAVVVGKNQNSTEEIDAAYVEDRKIAVVRRLTGGGAVFHDLGNVNFTIISEDRAGEQFNDYALFTKPVRLFLETLGIRTERPGATTCWLTDANFPETPRRGMAAGCSIMGRSSLIPIWGIWRAR